MSDVPDSPSALVHELTALRQRVAQLEATQVERRQVDAELRREHAWLTSLLTTTQDAFVSIDRQGRIMRFNPAAERIFGYTAAEVHGQDLTLLMPQPYTSEHAGYIARYERTGEARAIGRIRRVSAKRKNGEVFPIELSVTEVALDEKVHYGAFIRDVSERAQLQERLLEREQYASLMKRAHAEVLKAKHAAEAANRAKSEFLATMSHELRSPLQIILGYTDLLREETFGPLTPEQTAPLYSIDRSALELLDLISALLDLSRLEADRLPLADSPVDVAQVLAEVRQETQVLQEQSQLAFVWQVDEPRLVVQTDPQPLKVILKNLLGNAIKYTEAGRITITARGHVGGVEIQIVDTGIGIPPEALSQIFEPFYQVDNSDRRKRGGVGLGLHIVRRFIERLGGRVDVESEVGRGTTFRVRIPLSPSAAGQVPSSED